MAINKIDLLSPGFVYRKSFCFLHRLLLYNFWWPPIFYRFYIEETFSTINSSTTSKKKTLFGNRCFKLDLSKYIFLTLIFNLWKRIYSFSHVMKCFQKFSRSRSKWTVQRFNHWGCPFWESSPQDYHEQQFVRAFCLFRRDFKRES